MIELLLALLPLQVQQTDFPESFRTVNMASYIGCIRGEAKGSPDQNASHIVQFSQVTSLCGEERSRWASELRGLIRTRHPDWTTEQVRKAIDFVISDFELEVLNFQHNFQDHAVHDMPEPRF
jgi:hypothetical protein